MLLCLKVFIAPMLNKRSQPTILSAAKLLQSNHKSMPVAVEKEHCTILKPENTSWTAVLKSLFHVMKSKPMQPTSSAMYWSPFKPVMKVNWSAISMSKLVAILRMNTIWHYLLTAIPNQYSSWLQPKVEWTSRMSHITLLN